MQITQDQENKLTLTAPAVEWEFIEQVLNVPLHAYGKNEFLASSSLSLDEANEVLEKVKSMKGAAGPYLSIFHDEAKKLGRAFGSACEVIGPEEIHALTGQPWTFAEEIRKQLEPLS